LQPLFSRPRLLRLLPAVLFAGPISLPSSFIARPAPPRPTPH
jgi:hypothetical protein